MRFINKKGLQLIEQFEGLSLTPYLDKRKIPTIGVGTTRYEDGTKVTMLDPAITVARAEELLNNYVNKDCKLLDQFLTVKGIKLGSNSFSALLCFSYNAGISAVIVPGKLMNLALLSGDQDKISRAFIAYNKISVKKNDTIKKEICDGLTNRRKAELALFMTKDLTC